MGIDNWQERVVPCIMHGDCARFTNKNEQKLLGIQMRSLLCDVGVQPRMFQFFAIVESSRYKSKLGYSQDTLAEVWPIVVQGLNDGARGVFSEELPDGSAWPSGTYYAARAGASVCGGDFIFIIWVLTGHAVGVAQSI